LYSTTTNYDSLYNVPILVDTVTYYTPKYFTLSIGNHTLIASPLFYSYDKFYIFDEWARWIGGKLEKITEDISLTYNVEEDVSLMAVYEIFNSGTSVVMREKQSKLYLHVYDIAGRHVGFNHETNQVEVQIPGAHYYDYQNGTIIILLPFSIQECLLIAAAINKRRGWVGEAEPSRSGRYG
jgi:hypothetical protein